MQEVPIKQAPSLAGFVLAAVPALVALTLTRLVFDWPWAAGLFVAAILFVVVGLILGIPGRDLPPKQTPVPPANTLAAGTTSAAVVSPSQLLAGFSEAQRAGLRDLDDARYGSVVAVPLAARRPESLSAARDGTADDLKIIKGIGPKLELLCHKLGFFHFDQVAAWTADEVAWVDENLEGFKGRVTRDRWVPQAKAIVTLGPETFLARIEKGEEF